MPPGRTATIEILSTAHDPNAGVVVDGEDCFPGDEVECGTEVARYLVALGRARFLVEPTTAAAEQKPGVNRRVKGMTTAGPTA